MFLRVDSVECAHRHVSSNYFLIIVTASYLYYMQFPSYIFKFTNFLFLFLQMELLVLYYNEIMFVSSYLFFFFKMQFQVFLDYTKEGSSFVFGDLIANIFAFQVSLTLDSKAVVMILIS